MENYYNIHYTGDEINALLGKINMKNYLEVIQDSYIIYEDSFGLLSEVDVKNAVYNYINVEHITDLQLVDGERIEHNLLRPALVKILNKGREFARNNNDRLEIVCFGINSQVMFVFNINKDGYEVILCGLKHRVAINGNFISAVASVEEFASKKYVEEALKALALNGYATEEFVRSEIAKAQLGADLSDFATKDELALKANRSELFSRDYNDLYNKPVIPSVAGLASEAFVNQKIAEAQLGAGCDCEPVDISGLATREELAGKADKSEIHNHTNKAILDNINEAKIAAWDEKSEFSGSYNDLTDKPVIPSVEGLATEEFVNQKIAEAQLGGGNGDCNCDLTGLATKEELAGKADKSEIPSIEGLASEAFVAEQIATIEHPQVDISGKVDKVEGKSLVADTEIEKLAGLFNANYQFKINMIAAGQPASVSMSGQYPNLVVTFNIPMGTAGEGGGEEPPVEDTGEPRLWYGYIPYDENGVNGFSEVDHINENMTMDIIQFGLDAEKLIETDPVAVGKIQLFAPDNAFLCVIMPTESNLVARMDNGIGGKILYSEFDKESGLSWDDKVLVNKIKGNEYRVSGFYVTTGGGNFIMYVD